MKCLNHRHVFSKPFKKREVSIKTTHSDYKIWAKIQFNEFVGLIFIKMENLMRNKTIFGYIYQTMVKEVTMMAITIDTSVFRDNT